MRLAEQARIDRDRIVMDAAVTRAAAITGDWPERAFRCPIVAYHDLGTSWAACQAALERWRAHRRWTWTLQNEAALAWINSQAGREARRQRENERWLALATARASRLTPRQERDAMQRRRRLAAMPWPAEHRAA